MKIILLIIVPIVTSIISFNAPGPGNESTDLYPIRLNGKAGYIDRDGQIVIKPRFMRAWEFAEGLAPVQISDKPEFGYINKQGNFVIGPWRGTASVFSEGLGRISRSSEGQGFIDHTGRTVIKPEFAFAESFSDGMAQVILDQCVPKVDCGAIGYIDKSGNVAVRPQFRAANDFHEGRAAVRRGRDEWTFIDKTGEEITKQRFKSDLKNSLVVTTDFSEGLAGVKVEGKWGFIDTNGKMVIPPQFDEALKFSEGLAAVFIECRWGYIDKTGAFVIKPQFKYATEFSEGLAAVDPYPSNDGPCPPGKSHAKLGYINRAGEVVINVEFDLAFKFKNGVARVVVVNPKDQNDLKQGYINKTGTYIWKPTSKN
jgi:hypothetical protein